MGRFAEMSAGDNDIIDVSDVDHPKLKELLESLDNVTAVRSSDPSFIASWMARCLVHDDKSPSLSIGLRKNGRVTIHCFAGCSRDAIIRAVGMEKADFAPPRTRHPEELIVARYDYRDESEKLLYQVCRYPNKSLPVRRPDGRGGWLWGRGGITPILYRLPEVIAAVTRGETVFVCEGEKDVDRLVSLGLCATCNPNGAGKWKSQYSQFFNGADVVLLQDNDEPGQDHVRKVARALRKVAASIRIVLLPGLANKGDVSDWLDAGHTIEEFLEIVKGTSPVGASGGSAAGIGDDVERAQYAENEHGLWKLREGRDPMRLANFTARINRQIVEDDGVEPRTMLEIEAKRAGRTKVFAVAAREFSEMHWPTERIDARAAIMPFVLPREVNYVMKLLSTSIVEDVIYTHTGWRDVPGYGWVYLHGAGAIGADGAVPGLSVRLDSPLAPMILPEPPTAEERRTAIRAVLSLLELAPDRVMIPPLAATFRSTMGPPGFSIHYLGASGVFKTQLAALFQQFFGGQFDADHLPGSWSSTGNAIEGLLFQAKDMVVVIDDFSPRGQSGEVQRLHQLADRVLRNVANHAARGRLRADLTLRPPRPPRGFVLSTGEDSPLGHSLTARILLIEVAAGDVMSPGALSAAQELARDGEFARCMSAFLQFHARTYSEFEASRAAIFASLRGQATRGSEHRRTPSTTANGMLAWQRFLEFAVEDGAITIGESRELERRGWAAFNELADVQGVYQAQQNQARLFVALVAQAVQSGMAHLTTFDGSQPPSGASCGWRCETIGENRVIKPLGLRIGYVEDDKVYLIKMAAYRLAQNMAKDSTHNLSLSTVALGKRLEEEGLLKAGESRGGKDYSTIRKTISKKRQALWEFDAATFGFADDPEDSPPGDGYDM